MTRTKLSPKDMLMRYTPVALAVCLIVAVSSSASLSAPPKTLDPRAAVLVAQARSALTAGDAQAATDAYESALTVEPGSVMVLVGLADASRRAGLQGKALRYYRAALEVDPRNLAAIAGEGEALAEKGATEKANRNLARLQGLCGEDCAEAQLLAAAITKGPVQRVVTAEAATPKPIVSEN